MKKLTCMIAGNIPCKAYSFCRSEYKDKTPEKCKLRFDYAYQSFGRKFVISCLTFDEVVNLQSQETGK